MSQELKNSPGPAQTSPPKITVPGTCCSLTDQPLKDPLIAKNGLSYEAFVVSECIKGERQVDAKTLAILKDERFPPQRNIFLRRFINSVEYEKLLTDLGELEINLATSRGVLAQQAREIADVDTRLHRIELITGQAREAKKHHIKKKLRKEKLASRVTKEMAAAEEGIDPLYQLALQKREEEMNEDPPPGFECVIELSSFLKDPVFAWDDGASYERERFMEEAFIFSGWRGGKFAHKNCVNNIGLRQAISAYTKGTLQHEHELARLTTQIEQQTQTLADKQATLQAKLTALSTEQMQEWSKVESGIESSPAKQAPSKDPQPSRFFSSVWTRALTSDYTNQFEKLMKKNWNCNFRLQNLSLAEFMALYSPWPTAEKREMLKKLADRGVVLAEPFLTCTLGGSIQAIESRAKIQKIQRDENGNHLLHYAAANGHQHHIREILNRKNIFNVSLATCQNNNGDTALTIAAQNGRLEIVKCLLQQYKPAISLDTIIQKAAASNHYAVVEWLEDEQEKLQPPSSNSEVKKSTPGQSSSPYRSAVTDKLAKSSERKKSGTPGQSASPYRTATTDMLPKSTDRKKTPGEGSSPYIPAAVGVAAGSGVDQRTVLTVSLDRDKAPLEGFDGRIAKQDPQVTHNPMLVRRLHRLPGSDIGREIKWTPQEVFERIEHIIPLLNTKFNSSKDSNFMRLELIRLGASYRAKEWRSVMLQSEYEQGMQGVTYFFTACGTGNNEQVDYLLQSCDYSARDVRELVAKPLQEGTFKGATPFFILIKNNQLAVLKRICKVCEYSPAQFRELMSTPVSFKGYRGSTPLLIVAVYGLDTMLQYILRMGKYTPEQLRADIVKAIPTVSEKAPAGGVKTSKLTVLGIIIYKQNLKLLEIIREKLSVESWQELMTAPVRGGEAAEGKIPLVYAVMSGNYDMVQYLYTTVYQTPENFKQAITKFTAAPGGALSAFAAAILTGSTEILDSFREKCRFTSRSWQELMHTPFAEGPADVKGKTPLNILNAIIKRGHLDFDARDLELLMREEEPASLPEDSMPIIPPIPQDIKNSRPAAASIAVAPSVQGSAPAAEMELFSSATNPSPEIASDRASSTHSLASNPHTLISSWNPQPPSRQSLAAAPVKADDEYLIGVRELFS